MYRLDNQLKVVLHKLVLSTMNMIWETVECQRNESHTVTTVLKYGYAFQDSS